MFSVSRGVLQKYPISPYLFLLCAEILGIAIRESKDIKGFCYKRKEIKLSQYADDAQILLDGSEKSVRKLNFLKYFSLVSMIKSKNATSITNAEYRSHLINTILNSKSLIKGNI